MRVVAIAFACVCVTACVFTLVRVCADVYACACVSMHVVVFVRICVCAYCVFATVSLCCCVCGLLYIITVRLLFPWLCACVCVCGVC